MRPKNLKFPFIWEERHPVFHQGVFFIPQLYDLHHQWKDEQGLFSKDGAIFIEYCSGNGDWVIERAKQNPHQIWIAVEKQFERVRKIWSKMHNQCIENLIIVCGEALTFTKHYLQMSSISEIFVNFPDPWPKTRHAKHRLIQAPFIEELSKVLKTNGHATFATDDPPYSSQMIREMLGQKNWRSVFPDPYFIHHWENYGSSWFQNLWQNKGHRFYYMQFEKI